MRSQCSIADCEGPSVARGLCQAHYDRVRRHGDLAIEKTRRSYGAARWQLVNKDGPLPDAHPEYGNCWLWTGGRDGRGYGAVRVAGRHEKMHRVAYAEASGEMPAPEYPVGHTCDTPACVRNDEPGTYDVNGLVYPRFGHLFLCTHTANIADRDAKGRMARGERGGRTKLTEAQAAMLAARYGAGETQTALAAELGVSVSTVNAAIRRRNWKHI